MVCKIRKSGEFGTYTGVGCNDAVRKGKLVSSNFGHFEKWDWMAHSGFLPFHLLSDDSKRANFLQCNNRIRRRGVRRLQKFRPWDQSKHWFWTITRLFWVRHSLPTLRTIFSLLSIRPIEPPDTSQMKILCERELYFTVDNSNIGQLVYSDSRHTRLLWILTPLNRSSMIAHMKSISKKLPRKCERIFFGPRYRTKHCSWNSAPLTKNFSLWLVFLCGIMVSSPL